MARTFTTTERTTVAAARTNHYTTLEITDPDGSWRDVSTSLATPDWYNEATLTESIDSNTLSLTATLLRDTGTLALAPLRTDSTINRNAANAYAPMLDVKRQWRVKVAVTAPGASPVMKEIGAGYIDRIDVQDPAPTITVTGRGMEAPLLDGYISVVRTYCSSGPLPVETVIQQMIDDTLGTGADASLGGLATTGSSGITLYTPTYSPTYYINQGYRPAVGNLMDALTHLAQLAGMVLRYRYDASDVNRLTLATVNRNPTVADWSIGPTEYTSLPVNALDLSGVRTWIDLYYVDASLGQQHVTSPSTGTSDAITRYGKRYMRVDVAGSVTLTSANAQLMADAMRSDLELPALEQRIESPGLWFAQLYDYVTTSANGVQYDQDQAGGITAITQHLSGGTITTTLSLRGKPAGRYRTWLRYATQPINALVYNQCVAKVTATSATTITVTVTASAPSGTPTVTLSAITGTATLASGPALGTASPSGTVWVFNRGAALGGSGAVQFTADFGGNVSDTDVVAIPEQGRDTTYLASRARVIASDATTVTVRYAVADPYPQGSGSVTLTYQTQNVGTVTPASGSTVTPNATITENAGTYVDYTITRPAFATGTGRVTFTATAAGRISDSDAVDVPAQEKTSFGPSLTVTPTAGATTYSLAWSGDNVQVAINGGAYGTPSASPITVSRPAVNAPDTVYAFKATLDGQVATDSVTIPAIGATDTNTVTPDLTVTPGAQTATTQPYTVSASNPSGGAAPSITVTIHGTTGTDTTTSAAIAADTPTTVASGDVITVTRPAFGSTPATVTFTASLAGNGKETIQRTVLNQDALPIPKISSNQATRTQSAVALSLSCNNLPATYTWFLTKSTNATNGNQFYDATGAGAVASGSNSATPLPQTVNVTASAGQDDHYVLVVQTANSGWGGYTATCVVQATMPAVNTSGNIIRTVVMADGSYAAAASTSDGYTLHGSATDSRSYALNTHFNTAHHNLDNVPMTGTYGAPLNTRLNAGRPVIDFTETIHSNKHLGNIPDDASSGRYAVVAVDGNRRPIVDFTSSHVNKHLGNIPDDAGSGRYAVASVDGNRRPIVDFSSGHVNKNLAYISDGGGRYAAAEAGADVTGSHTAADTAAVAGAASSTVAQGAARANGALDANNRLTEQARGRITSIGNIGSVQTSNPLSATWNSGTGKYDATIAQHDLQAGGRRLTYNAGSVSGLNASSTYYIYASDANWAGGTVGYQASIYKENAVGTDDYYYVGSITTGASGGTATTGGGGGSGGCFPADTPVQMADGTTRSIASVRAGDTVLAFDERRRTLVPHAVIATHAHDAQPVLRLTTDDGSAVVTTSMHRFYRPSGDWTAAGALAIGDSLVRVSQNGILRRVRLTDITAVADPAPVYNLTVAECPTYVAAGYVVHNVKLQ